MDGNGRWAENRRRPRIFGHVRGARAAETLVTACSEKKIPFLTLFAFSSENRLRPKTEVKALFRLLEKAIARRASLLKELDIRLHVLGDLSPFPEKAVRLLEGLQQETANHKGMNLILALNYGGRQEILSAARALVREAAEGRLQEADLNQAAFERRLPSGGFPPPDLIIRTGGRMRLSNFYLWSAAYSELYFTPTLWPDFSEKELDKALGAFSRAERRFGRISGKKA